MAGPAFCTGCGTTLCSACSRFKAHKQCPDCSEKAGAPRSKISGPWFAYLLVDSLLQSVRTARTRVLLFVLASSLAATTGIVMMVSDVFPEGGEASLLMALPLLMPMLGVLIAPALVVPLRDALSVGKQMKRAVVGALLPLTFVAAFAGLTAAATFALIGSEDSLANIAGMAVILVAIAVGGLGLVTFVYPIQAFVAVRGTSPIAAMAMPFRAGMGTVLVMIGAHAMLSTSSFSALDMVTNVVTLASLFSPWVGLAVGWPLCALIGTVILFGMGAYGAATLRYIEDRLSLRGS